jgi:hypothetical protein
MFFLVFALFFIYVCGLSGAFNHRQGSFKMLGDVFHSTVVDTFSNVSDITSAYGKAMSKNKISKNVIIGIALAIPALLVIIPLLVSSDAAFENLVLIVIKNVGKYIIEIVITLLITPLLIFYAVSKKYNSKDEIVAYKKSNRGVLNGTVTITFLSVISVTYVVYLFSQLAYFFSAFSGILPAGYTFTASGYARRGFFEMFAICVINMIIIALANMLTKRVKGKIPVAVKAISTFIMLFTVLILITAMQKMKLNIEIFGLSKNRLLVSVFMLMIFIIIFFYVLHIFAPKVGYMQPIIIICSAMFIALSYSNINAIIVNYNVQAYDEGRIESLDIDYIDSISNSAMDSIVELTKSDNHLISKRAKTIVISKLSNDYLDDFNYSKIDSYNYGIEYTSSNDFRTYNYTNDKACKVLEEFYNSLSPDERKNIVDQYNFDMGVENGNYYYNEESDIYERYVDDYCYEYSYNDDSDSYELSDKYKIDEYYSNDEENEDY